MAVILRVDVDEPYGWENPLMLILNYLRINWGFPEIEKLGYLKYLKLLADDLNDRGISATFFFQTITVPKDAAYFNGHELALHSAYASNYTEFISELNQVSHKLGTNIRGFSKHGSGTRKLGRKHAWQYTSKKFIEWAQKAGLDYFSGNGENPEEQPHSIGNIIYFPSAFWLDRGYREKRFDIQWLAGVSRQRDIVVILHPFYWGTNRQVREDYECMMKKIDSFKIFPKTRNTERRISTV